MIKDKFVITVNLSSFLSVCPKKLEETLALSPSAGLKPPKTVAKKPPAQKQPKAKASKDKSKAAKSNSSASKPKKAGEEAEELEDRVSEAPDAETTKTETKKPVKRKAGAVAAKEEDEDEEEPVMKRPSALRRPSKTAAESPLAILPFLHFCILEGGFVRYFLNFLSFLQLWLWLPGDLSNPHWYKGSSTYACKFKSTGKQAFSVSCLPPVSF